MGFEPALAAELDTIAALNHRIYPLNTPDDVKFDLKQPYLIYATNAGLRTKTLYGYGDSKQVSGELNIIVPSPRYSDLKSITSDVIDLLAGMEQRTIGTDGPYIQSIEYETPVELYEDKPKLYRCLIDFEMYF